MSLLPATSLHPSLSPFAHPAKAGPNFSPLRRSSQPALLPRRSQNSKPSRVSLVPRVSDDGLCFCRISSSSRFCPGEDTAGTVLLQLAAPVVFFLLGLGAASACAVGSPIPSGPQAAATTESPDLDCVEKDKVEEVDEEVEREFEAWKKKRFALTVPLRIVALRGSFPASWIKDFMQSQGKRARIIPEFRGNLLSIFSELTLESKKENSLPKSVLAADIVSIGDSWLSYAINACLIEPVHGIQDQKWFHDLSSTWKILLHRNKKGELDPNGEIWGVPYRWGSMVIAYKEDKFKKKGFAPVEDWGDLWRPELAGKISMVDSPREVVGAVLKYMGASYNTKDIASQVPGGRDAVMQNLTLLQRQVKLFDSIHYLKAFTSGDVWVAVGWSNDVLPTVKRMSNVAVITPKSGSSLWADLWAIPAASKFASNQIGGRVRGPSPLIYQWIEFCLQPARAFPFKQEIIPGSSPSDLGFISGSMQHGIAMGKPAMDANLFAGMPPPEILARCEFLEPLPEDTLTDYRWLIARMQKPLCGWIARTLHCLSTIIQRFSSNALWR